MYRTPSTPYFIGVKALSALSQNLRRLRLGAGLTQQVFAEKVGMGYKHYQDVEAGRAPGLALSTVQKFADAFGVEVWTLFHPDAVPEVEKIRARSPRIDR